MQVASHCVWHPIFAWETAFHYGGGDTALLTIGRTTGECHISPAISQNANLSHRGGTQYRSRTYLSWFVAKYSIR